MKRQDTHFLGHESEDLATFLQVAMLNGWDGCVLPQQDYVSLAFSNDEYLELYAEHASNIGDIPDFLMPIKG